MQDYCKTFDNKPASTEDFKAVVEGLSPAAVLRSPGKTTWFCMVTQGTTHTGWGLLAPLIPRKMLMRCCQLNLTGSRLTTKRIPWLKCTNELSAILRSPFHEGGGARKTDHRKRFLWPPLYCANQVSPDWPQMMTQLFGPQALARMGIRFFPSKPRTDSPIDDRTG